MRRAVCLTVGMAMGIRFFFLAIRLSGGPRETLLTPRYLILMEAWVQRVKHIP
jgi:hypothetical protein